MPVKGSSDENETAFSLKFIGEKSLKKYAKLPERNISEIFITWKQGEL